MLDVVLRLLGIKIDQEISDSIETFTHRELDLHFVPAVFVAPPTLAVDLRLAVHGNQASFTFLIDERVVEEFPGSTGLPEHFWGAFIEHLVVETARLHPQDITGTDTATVLRDLAGRAVAPPHFLLEGTGSAARLGYRIPGPEYDFRIEFIVSGPYWGYTMVPKA